jgi:hypothetical protein
MGEENLTPAVYQRPDVSKSIQKAQQMHDATKLDDDGETRHYTVFVQGPKVYTVLQGSSAPGVPVFDTEEGRYIE